MDLLSPFGILIAAAGIAVGFLFEGGRFGLLLHWQGLLIVLGGTAGAVMAQNTWSTFRVGVGQIRWLLSSTRPVTRDDLGVLLEWGHQAKLDGMRAFDSLDLSGIDAFARRGLELLANGVSTAVMEDSLRRELDAYERQQFAGARIWFQAGGYAPTFGILGAVLGLMQMTNHLLEPAQLGDGIAMAFVTTLYGVALANIVFLPIHGKIKVHVDSRLRYRKLYADGLLAISRREAPSTIETRLTGEVRESEAGFSV